MTGFVLSAISARELASYEVTLSCDSNEVVFVMRVEGDDVEVVTWDEDFDHFVALDTNSAVPVFRAVLEFHKARRVLLAPRQQ